MVERRTLIEGLNSTPPALNIQQERAIVYGNQLPRTESVAPVNVQSRLPLSTRIRSDFSLALKRASLERQLKGVEPNTLQDILEEAIETWLKSNDCLT